MADETTVITTDGGEDLDDQAAHAAAVAEGAAGVHEDLAEEAAEDAQASAELAASAAMAVNEGVADAVEAAQVAESAAEVSVSALAGIESAVRAQTETLAMLAQELRESRTPAPAPEPVKETPDQAPASPAHGYYGRIGRRR